MVHLDSSRALAQSFAVQLSQLQQEIVAAANRDGPESAFAWWAQAATDTLLPLESVAPQPRDLPASRWVEAPMLAAVGFHLAARMGGADLSNRWMEGIERLMARDAIPADRNSFFFRPIEVLGLSAGASAVAASNIRPTNWLRETLDANAHRITAATVWQRSLYSLAARHVGTTLATIGAITPTSPFDTAVLLWVHLVDEGLGARLSSSDTATLRAELLSTAATSGVARRDAAEAAVAWIALYRAVLAAVGALNDDPTDPARFVVRLCRNFPLFVNELGRRHASRPPMLVQDEYDVQDLLRGLLRLHFADVRSEEWTPSYGAIHARTDLLLKAERVVIETKMCRRNLTQRDVVQQLTADKAQYRTHPDCGTLVCFVYDPECRLGNPVALEDDLSEVEPQLRTLVVVSPQLRVPKPT